MNDEQYLQCSARHEASHAVSYLHFGIDVEYVEMTLDGTGNCHAVDLPQTREAVVAILAGPEADKLFFKDDPVRLEARKSGWRGDLAESQRILRHLGKKEDELAREINAASQEARQLVLARRVQIEAIGTKLYETLMGNYQESEGADHSARLNGGAVRNLYERTAAQQSQ